MKFSNCDCGRSVLQLLKTKSIVRRRHRHRRRRRRCRRRVHRHHSFVICVAMIKTQIPQFMDGQKSARYHFLSVPKQYRSGLEIDTHEQANYIYMSVRYHFLSVPKQDHSGLELDACEQANHIYECEMSFFFQYRSSTKAV